MGVCVDKVDTTTSSSPRSTRRTSALFTERSSLIVKGQDCTSTSTDCATSVKMMMRNENYNVLPPLQQHASLDEEEQQLLREIEDTSTEEEEASADAAAGVAVVKSSSNIQRIMALSSSSSSDGEPCSFDVLLGRGKSNTHHPGNQMFQYLVLANRERYFATTSAIVKRAIVAEMVKDVEDKGGRFLRKNNGVWEEVDEEVSHQKVAHAIQYRRRRSIKQDGNDGDEKEGDVSSENDEPPKPKRRSSSKPKRKSSTSTTSSSRNSKGNNSKTKSLRRSSSEINNDKEESKAKRRRCRQQANEAARSWLQQSAFPLKVVASLSSGTGKSKATASRAKVDEDELDEYIAKHSLPEGAVSLPPPSKLHGGAVPPLPPGVDEAGVLEGFENPNPLNVAALPLPVAATSFASNHNDPLDCSGLHSLADLLSCMESQELFSLTTASAAAANAIEQQQQLQAQTQSGATGTNVGAPMSLRQVVARQFGRASAIFPMNPFMAALSSASSSSIRQSSVGTFDPRLDDLPSNQQQQQSQGAHGEGGNHIMSPRVSIVYNPDTFEPHPVHSSIDPLDCSGLHSLADILSCIESNNNGAHHALKAAAMPMATSAPTTMTTTADVFSAAVAAASVANSSLEHYISTISNINANQNATMTTAPVSIASSISPDNVINPPQTQHLHTMSNTAARNGYGTVAL